MLPIRPSHLLKIGLPAALVAAGLATITGSSVSAAEPKPFYNAFPVPGRSAPAAAEVEAYDPHSVLVKFSPKASKSARANVLAKHNSRQAAAPVTGDYATVTSNAAAPELLKKLKAESSVELASLNYIRKSAATPNDEYYGVDQKYLSTIRMPEAWNLSKSAGTQTVAVLDTGVDGGHPELAGRVYTGYNALNPKASANDDEGHGTMVAGIIAANTNNGRGVAGVAWNARILPVKVLNAEGSGSDSSVVAGINWAASHGARVINMSLGGRSYNPVMHDAVKKAVAKGIVVVAASGNEYDSVPEYPAAFPETISVGATDNNGALTTFSSWGDSVDLTAPGWNILSTGPRALLEPEYLPYLGGSGTSFSAPMVAGVAAMLRNKYPSWTPAQIEARLKSTARDAGPRGIDPYYGAGVLDAANALGATWAPEFWAAGPDGNDLPVRATAMTTSTTGAIGTEGDEDWYSVQSSAPRNVTVTVSPPGYDPRNRTQNLDPMLSVYDAQLRLIGFSDAGDKEAEKVTLTLPAGRAYLKVANYNGSRDSRPYSLAVAGTSTGGSAVGQRVWLRDSAPANLTGGVPQNYRPSVAFERPFATASMGGIKLLHGKTGATIAATTAYEADTNRVTIAPTSPLQDNTPYRISVRGVKDTSGATMPGSHHIAFRTVDVAPAPITNFTVTGQYGSAGMKWTLPGITDLDQVVVRRNAGTTPPSAPNTGTAAYGGQASSATATGLANATSYAFRAWVKDRSGKWSSSVTANLTGTYTSLSANATALNFGGKVTLSGSAVRVDTKAPLAGVPVSLYGRNKNSSTWREITRVATSATGQYSVSYQPTYSTVFAWGYNGSATLLGSRTGNWTVDVRPTITANLSATSIKLGASTTFYGYVRPQHAGSSVYLQRSTGSTWTTITSTKLNSTGNYAFSIKPTARAGYTYRVVFQSDGDHATGVSPAKSFTVS
ncbi:peptidase S8 and S53 subtilisin kexin sedolisin [Kribbella flavida DSM 17836]|uniref:Peptidase S8 and S53 subtilisin kexin sedolisin n=1 Tax=Kribbella flavida (strain DSM 17836 / JCM 10339 / NBRC 14399) TaxID=479435 RepID=D2PV43_KRIFD|nr:S8 family serine peptidase [Kribbella flavida]ADB33324.1 peptidase S8 and S53 subtilisin kexin sedolisin [Kribbella flavida DSM 17836]